MPYSVHVVKVRDVPIECGFKPNGEKEVINRERGYQYCKIVNDCFKVYTMFDAISLFAGQV